MYPKVGPNISGNIPIMAFISYLCQYTSRNAGYAIRSVLRRRRTLQPLGCYGGGGTPAKLRLTDPVLYAQTRKLSGFSCSTLESGRGP